MTVIGCGFIPVQNVKAQTEITSIASEHPVDEVYYVDIESAGKFLKEGMQARKTNIHIYYHSEGGSVLNVAILLMIMMHND